jgi:acyl-CoA synthetase (AMP-forming)/AMP-acid ligase II
VLTSPVQTVEPPAILDSIAASAAAGFVVHFDERPVRLTKLWAAAPRSLARLDCDCGHSACVAMVLTATPECVAALLGVWRAGRQVVSLPLPGRGQDPNDYLAVIRRQLDVVGASHVVGDPVVVKLAAAYGVPAVAYPELDAGGGTTHVRAGDTVGASLVQFTSGSTGDPQGVALGLDAVAANVEAILTVLDPKPGAVACSWLPLSHDMGLIGMLLASLCAGRPDIVNGGALHLFRPEQFLQNPHLWLQRCADTNATITAAPNFALDIAVRAALRKPPRSLRHLQSIIVGGETVRAEAMKRFETAFTPAGLQSTALCPAYGLAEATLAVTMNGPDETWTAKPTPDGHSVVSCGRPVPGMRLHCESSTAATPAPISIGGPSLLQRYIGGPAVGDWFHTNDEGFVANDLLHVTGRTDNVLVIAGRNIYATDIEDRLHSVEGVRRGGAAIWQEPDGALVVACELAAETDPSDLRPLARRIEVIVSALAARPNTVLILAPGALLKTPSGKTRRPKVAEALTAGTLTVLQRFDR